MRCENALRYSVTDRRTDGRTNPKKHPDERSSRWSQLDYGINIHNTTTMKMVPRWTIKRYINYYK